MKYIEYAKQQIQQFGHIKAIQQLDNAIDTWKFKRKHQETKGIEICDQTIRYFQKTNIYITLNYLENLKKSP